MILAVPSSFVKELQKRKKWREPLGCLIMWEGHAECQIEYHLGDAVLQLRLQLAQAGVPLSHVGSFIVVLPHKLQPIETYLPPIQYSGDRAQEELLYVIQWRQQLASEAVNEFIEHLASGVPSFW